MATIGTRIFTWLNGKEVGKDEQGNRYYVMKRGGKVHADSLRKERRWVIFNGEDEASRIPPEWHAWMHHTVEAVPDSSAIVRRSWQKPHEPNHTGTEKAYHPKGHALSGGQRQKAAGDYEAWSPE
ncbi:NADH:ubiquinone oxidoreductase subunit NDUFA12 [Rhodovibrionaceae bacterium A322]